MAHKILSEKISYSTTTTKTNFFFLYSNENSNIKFNPVNSKKKSNLRKGNTYYILYIHSYSFEGNLVENYKTSFVSEF